MSLTVSQVTALVGCLDTNVIADILATGATEAEIAEAKRLATKSDQPVPPPAASARTPLVHRVYDILRADMGVRDERS